MKRLQEVRQTELCPVLRIKVSVTPCQRHLGIRALGSVHNDATFVWH